MSVLGVDKSLSGRPWRVSAPGLDSRADAIRAATGIDPILARILARKGVDAADVADHLKPRLRSLLPEPYSFLDMERAATRIARAVRDRQRVAIFGDYDVDGATSSAQLIQYFRHFGLSPTLYIPDRVAEGYGPNAPAMRHLAMGHDLIICVDCGTLAHEALAAGRAENDNCDVVVLDHHTGGETLPEAAHAVVNPNRQDEDNTYGYLCAAGVVFITLVAVNRLLRRQDSDGPDLLGLLDLVALGTVADVSPLVGLNRAFVVQGLELTRERPRAGIAALKDAARVNEPLRAEHVSFSIAPRLNAGGRIGRAHAATELLIETDPARAARRAEEIEHYNQERRAIEAMAAEEAIAAVEAARGGGGAPRHLVYAVGDWHAGVIGILASRLKSRFDLPAFAFSSVGGMAHASARSVDGIDLGGLVARLLDDGLIIKGGGHAMAAGLSLRADQIAPAMARIDERLAHPMASRPPSGLDIDAVIAPAALSLDLAVRIEQAGPFGAGAPAPVFAVPDLNLKRRIALGTDHLKFIFEGRDGARIEALSFRSRGGPFDAQTAGAEGQRFHLAGAVKRDMWQGREKITLLVNDLARAHSAP